MNEETNILLAELVEAVNRPDWWIIALTAINTIAVIVIACMQYRMQLQQTKLQEQQTKAQEYDVYRKLYCVFYEADEVVKGLLNFIDRYFSVSLVRKSNPNGLTRYQDKALNMINRISNNAIDVDLKFANGGNILSEYRQVLMEAVSVLHIFIDLENNKLITLSEDNRQIRKLHPVDDERIVVNSILERITDETMLATTSQILNDYIEREQVLLNLNIAYSIKERIMPIGAL